MLAFRETKFSSTWRQSYTRLRNGRWLKRRSRRLRLSHCWKRRTDYHQNFKAKPLAAVDQFEIDALKKIDDYISRVGLAAPTENIPRLLDGYKKEEVTELNLQWVGISTVVWATGYAFDFSLVKLPVVDSDRYPIQKRGVTRYPGLYFLGLPWLYNRRSGILFGVGDDAAYLG